METMEQCLRKAIESLELTNALLETAGEFYAQMAKKSHTDSAAFRFYIDFADRVSGNWMDAAESGTALVAQLEGCL